MNIKDEDSHPYKTTGILLLLCMFKHLRFRLQTGRKNKFGLTGSKKNKRKLSGC
jgi:hypothetical protein